MSFVNNFSLTICHQIPTFHFMPNFENRGKRRASAVVILNRLVVIGWIDHLIVNDTANTFTFVWTEKGKQRAAQLAEIVNEFRGGGEDLLALVAIYRSHLP
jgi:hypothetical protein